MKLYICRHTFVGKRQNASRQTRLVLAALAEAPQHWWYGYDLGKAVGLKSGTIYPLLIRLEEQGLLEAEWRPSEVPSRPPRHMYRLTADGVRLAHQAAAEAGDGGALCSAASPA